MIYYNEAINQPDAIEFAKAIFNKVNGHVDSDDWELFPRDTDPGEVTPVLSIWSMLCKHDLVMDEVMRYEAHLNLHSGKQELGANYFVTFAPVMTWMAICLL